MMNNKTTPLEIIKRNDELGFNDLIISPFNNSIIEFLKFIFTDNLLNQYQSIYILCSKAGLGAEYINSIAPVEQQVFIKLYADEIEEQNKQLKSKSKNITIPT